MDMGPGQTVSYQPLAAGIGIIPLFDPPGAKHNTKSALPYQGTKGETSPCHASSPHAFSPMRKRKTSIWLIAALLLAALGGVSLSQRTQYHPYLVFQATESLQMVFLQRGHGLSGDCETAVNRIADAVLGQCRTCRLVEKRCLEQLDSRQRKILSGQPLDIPVMRTPGGAVAFLSTTPGFAQEVCREAERQTAPGLNPRCARAGPDGIGLSLGKISGAKDSELMLRPDALLGILLLALVVSFLACWFVIRSGHLHGRYSHDITATGPQKFHTAPTPRIGGVAIAAALGAVVLALEALDWLNLASAYGLTMLALAAIPAFAGGFGEDVTRKVGVLARLMLTFASAAFASLLVGATLDRLDTPGLDTLLLWPIFAIAFTAFAVGGIANAINIIDGYNGLAGGYAVIVLAALAWVAGQVGDPVVLTASLAMLGAILGFLAWNYPGGKIFMGDGGAYLLGFWLGELAVLLVVRNPDVSPWLPLMLLAYPITDTLFSIYRRFILRGRSAGNADAMHLHQLIYMRLARIAVASRDPEDRKRRNNLVAPYIWAGAALFTLSSLLVWRSTPWLVGLAVCFWVGYLWLYFRLARWRAPAWMIVRQEPSAASRQPSVGGH
jgi:UDP-GlcNAc:undecaprenyl-phosphate/decaprenyl-phosphate GlcNAc-1-phosphate transferase